MNNEIAVNIISEGEKVYIVFNFESKVKLEITSNSGEEAKKVFYEILKHIINNNHITFKFDKNGDDLYNEVTEKYVKTLNDELEALRKNFSNPLEKNEKLG